MSQFYVHREFWARWPRALMMTKRNGSGNDETRKYVPDKGKCKVSASFLNPTALEHVQEYHCSECGKYMLWEVLDIDDRPRFCANCGREIEWKSTRER